MIVGADNLSGRPHELGLVGVSNDGNTLRAVEAKGGDSASLDTRMVDGTRVQQGSTTYLRDLLHRDVRLHAYLSSHPDFAHRLAAGNVDVEYTLVNARTNGTVRISPFIIDTSRLDLSDLAPLPVPAGR